MLVRIKRVELKPLMTGGAGGYDHSTYGVEFNPEHEQIVAITEHQAWRPPTDLQGNTMATA